MTSKWIIYKSIHPHRLENHSIYYCIRSYAPRNSPIDGAYSCFPISPVLCADYFEYISADTTKYLFFSWMNRFKVIVGRYLILGVRLDLRFSAELPELFGSWKGMGDKISFSVNWIVRVVEKGYPYIISCYNSEAGGAVPLWPWLYTIFIKSQKFHLQRLISCKRCCFFLIVVVILDSSIRFISFFWSDSEINFHWDTFWRNSSQIQWLWRAYVN